MTVKWRFVGLPDYEPDYADTVEPAYILLDGKSGGEFAFGCLTAALYGATNTKYVEFDRNDNDEMYQVDGGGWGDLQAEGSARGQICSTLATTRLHRTAVEEFFSGSRANDFPNVNQ